MAALIFLFLKMVAALFRSKSRLEAENAALRHQLIVLQRKVRGRVHVAQMLANRRPIAIMRRPCSDSTLAASQMDGMEYSEATTAGLLRTMAFAADATPRLWNRNGRSRFADS
jgi:hypothetical protein